MFTRPGKLTVCYWTWPFSSWIFPLNMVNFHGFLLTFSRPGNAILCPLSSTVHPIAWPVDRHWSPNMIHAGESGLSENGVYQISWWISGSQGFSHSETSSLYHVISTINHRNQPLSCHGESMDLELPYFQTKPAGWCWLEPWHFSWLSFWKVGIF